MSEMAGESLKQHIAEFDATCPVAESQGQVALHCRLRLSDGQASSFLRSGPLEVSFRQLIAKIRVALKRMHEINVERVGQFVCQLRFETLDHLEMKLAIELLRGNLFLQLGKGHIEDLLLPTIAMSFDYQQPVGVGHHQKEGREVIAIKAGLAQRLIQMCFAWL